jgi:hypothetical protein
MRRGGPETVQAQLGLSGIILTADTYTSVLTDLLAFAAEATARLVVAKCRSPPPTWLTTA